MAQILVRDLEKSTVDALKSRARKNKHSLQVEVKEILSQAAKMSLVDFAAETRRIRAMLAGRKFSDSTLFVSEDRER